MLVRSLNELVSTSSDKPSGTCQLEMLQGADVSHYQVETRDVSTLSASRMSLRKQVNPRSRTVRQPETGSGLFRTVIIRPTLDAERF